MQYIILIEDNRINISNNTSYCIDTKQVLPRFGAALTLAVRATGFWFARVMIAVLNVLIAWQIRATQRRLLDGQSGHVLLDMVLSREDAIRESIKPFCRA